MPYNGASDKTTQVRDMFDSIAPRYDFLNHFLSLGIDRRWRARLVRMVGRGASCERLLDVATGTGDLAIALKRAQGNGVQVVGADLSSEMIDVARDKIARSGLEIETIVADVEAMPFAAESFDVVTCSFGVRNFDDTLLGLSRMQEVLKPDGRIYVLEFSQTSAGVFSFFYRVYFKNILPLIGRMISRDARAYSYLPESVESFASGEQFLELLRQAGFCDARQERLMSGVATIYSAVKRRD